jgi:hypothetical protein
LLGSNGQTAQLNVDGPVRRFNGPRVILESKVDRQLRVIETPFPADYHVGRGDNRIL